MRIDLSDGRTLGVPSPVPRLLRATPEQRQQLRISTRGLHWESLDENISIAAQADQTNQSVVPSA
jgi:Protein of unknown function (DUF2442)